MINSSSGDNFHLPTMALMGYATNSLAAEERENVAQHLSSCQTCRQELEDIHQLKGKVTSHFDSFPVPSPHVFERVMAITLEDDEEEVLQPQQTEKFAIHKAWNRLLTKIEEGVGTLFVPRWAPSLAVTLIVVQAALLFGTFDTPPGTREIAHNPMVVERSSSPTTPITKGILVQIALEENTPEKDLRAIIRNLEGRIVNGPSIDGVYIVELLEKNPNIADQKLQAVLSKTSTVRFIKQINP